MNNSKQLISSTFYCPFITQAEDSSALPNRAEFAQVTPLKMPDGLWSTFGELSHM